MIRRKFTFDMNTETGKDLRIMTPSTKAELQFPYLLSGKEDPNGVTLDIHVTKFSEFHDKPVEDSIRIIAFDIVIAETSGQELERRSYTSRTWFTPSDILTRILTVITGGKCGYVHKGTCTLLNAIGELRSAPLIKIYDTHIEAGAKCGQLITNGKKCADELAVLLEQCLMTSTAAPPDEVVRLSETIVNSYNALSELIGTTDVDSDAPKKSRA